MNQSQRVWPRQWLMSDERMGERLWAAIARVPSGRGGVVFRHYSVSAVERADLGSRIAEACRSRDLLLAVARDDELARRLGAELVHNPAGVPALPFSRSVHSLADAQSARRNGAALVFVSPIRATRSHPGAATLPTDQVRAIIRACGCPAIALGGMDAATFGAIQEDGFYGWAAIDAWLRT